MNARRAAPSTIPPYAAVPIPAPPRRRTRTRRPRSPRPEGRSAPESPSACPAIRRSPRGSSRAESRAPRWRRDDRARRGPSDWRRTADRSATCRRARGEFAGSPPRSHRRRRSSSARTAPSPGRATDPNAICCWARSRSSPLRSSSGSLCGISGAAARGRAERRGRYRPPPPAATEYRSRSCAASPRRRRGPESTSWWDRRHSVARRSAWSG